MKYYARSTNGKTIATSRYTLCCVLRPTLLQDMDADIEKTTQEVGVPSHYYVDVTEREFKLIKALDHS